MPPSMRAMLICLRRMRLRVIFNVCPFEYSTESMEVIDQLVEDHIDAQDWVLGH